MSTAIFGDIKRMLKVEVVTQLPTIGKSNRLYFVLNGDTAEENRYDEYIWVKDETHPDGYFELVGYKYVDLSPYYTKTEVDNLLSKKVDLTEYNQFKETTNQSITNLETKLDEHIEDFNDQVNNINSLNNTVNSLSNTVASHDTKFWNLENDTLPELQSTDAQLNQDVNTLTTNLNNEISSRTSQDTVLQANIDTVSNNLNDEITARTEADSNLQSQITNLTTVVNSKADAGSFKTINGESIEGTGDISIDLTLYRIVSSLPTTNIDNTKIYLVVNTESELNNEYIEYIYVNNKWEELGKYKADIDLSPYYNKTEVDAKLDTKLNIIDAETTYVAKEEGKGLSTNDFNNTYKSRLDWIEEFNTVSTLINIPCTRRLVIANIAVSETMSISAAIPKGREMHIIIKNTSDTDITITLPTDSRYIKLGVNSLIITPSSYAEVNIISNGTIFYVRFIVLNEYPQDTIMTIDSNPEVMAIMYANGLAANETYMTKTEAAAVVDSQLMSGNYDTSIFYNKSAIKSFNEFKYFTGITAIPSFMSCSHMQSIEIPSSVTSIGNGAFSGCSALTSIEIPEGVTSISNGMLKQCTSLTSVKLPTTLTKISDSAFQNSSALASIEIPSSVTTISNHAFSGCSALTSIKCLSSTAPTVSIDTFGYNSDNYTGRNTYNQGINMLYVPADSTGYEASYWLDPLCNSTKCGFTLYYDTPKYIDPSKAVAGDYCLYDKQADKLIIVQNDKLNVDDFPLTDYTPVGVVVIPGSHDVYGDGSCGVMSIKYMNCSTPNTGRTYGQGMYWGVFGTDITTLSNLNYVPYVGTGRSVGDSSSTVVGQYDDACLPSDKFNVVQCPHDTDAYYHSKLSVYHQAPSPYLTDGTRNPAYYQTSSPSTTSNALADFDGVGNTKKIIAQRGTKDYSSWLPTYNIEADYPAASCCDMFYTDGTKQGDWYLPACGELGYIMPPFNKINQSIAALKSAYGDSVGVQLDSGDYYWSSSEYSSNNARYVAADFGSAYNYDKNFENYVRAFLRV